MRRFAKILFGATLMMFASLTACAYESVFHFRQPGLDPGSPALAQFRGLRVKPAMTVAMMDNDNGNGNGLQSVLTFSDASGVRFLFRNETGRRLYYDGGFRLHSSPMRVRDNSAGLQFINHGDTKEAHVGWVVPRREGTFTFQRDFFLDANLTELYTTLTFDFEVNIPANPQAILDRQTQSIVEFHLAGGTSEIIVLASEVAVSRTAVAFETANLSTRAYTHGQSYSLFVYENGWNAVPMIIENLFVTGLGIRMRGGEVIEDRFRFEDKYGALPNGHYMLIRQHSQAGTPRVQEILLVEFVVDDDTPMSLEDS